MNNLLIYFSNAGIPGIIMLAALGVLGFVIATRGRRAMVWLVGVCAAAVGILAGAMIGLLVFDSFVLMILFALIGGIGFILLVRFVKVLGYFIGIGFLSFFIAYVVTSASFTANAKVPENTLLAADLVIGFLMGALSVVQWKYMSSVITCAAGGIICSVSVLALFGLYFIDWRTWLLALAVAALGMVVQVRKYDLRPKRRKKPVRNKHEKRE